MAYDMELSKNDLTIIKILKEDARTHFTKVGKMMGISDAAVHQRVGKMMEAGVIKRFTLEVDPAALGKNVVGYAFVNVNPGHIDEVSQGISLIENVEELYETHGPNDLLMKLTAGDLEEMRDTIVAIRSVPNVVGTELVTCFKKWK